MGNPLFATKPLHVIMEEADDTGEHSLRRALGPINNYSGYRRHHRRRHFCTHGTGSSHQRRSGYRGLVHPFRNHLRVRRTLLRGIRLADSDCGLCLHLRVRHLGRNLRLDHRLGSDSRNTHSVAQRWPQAGVAIV